MKNLLIASICLILCMGCRNEKAPSNIGGDTVAELDYKEGLTNLKASTYKSAFSKSLKSMPIDQLCKESKGYNQNEWEGKNACTWAVEKYRIGQHEEMVTRREGMLTLKLDESVITLSHPTDNGGATTGLFYQFTGYIKSANAFCVLQQPKDRCPQYWIIDRKDGSKTILNGLPVFNSQQDAFVLSTASQKANTCSNDVEYWELKSDKFVKSWSIKPSQDIYDIVWAKDKTWYGAVKSNGQKVTGYLQINPAQL